MYVNGLNADQEGMPSKSFKPKNSHYGQCTHLPNSPPPTPKKKKVFGTSLASISMYVVGAYYVQDILLGMMGNNGNQLV